MEKVFHCGVDWVDTLSRNQDFDLLRQKNKQMSSGGDKHLETPYFPQVGKAPSADSGREDASFPEPFRGINLILSISERPRNRGRFLCLFFPIFLWF